VHGRDPHSAHGSGQNHAKLLFHNLEIVNSEAGGLFYQEAWARVLVHDTLR
jgi:hypothetical protein